MTRVHEITLRELPRHFECSVEPTIYQPRNDGEDLLGRLGPFLLNQSRNQRRGNGVTCSEWKLVTPASRVFIKPFY